MVETSHPFAANVLGHLAAGDGPDHGADVGQRAEHGELQRARGASITKTLSQAGEGANDE